MNKVFSEAREIAHAGLAIVGALTLATSSIVVVLGVCGVQVTDTQVAIQLGVIGGVFTAVSKLIDSVNDAVTSRGTGVDVQPPPA